MHGSDMQWRRNDAAHEMARGLGWFSLALGAFEVLRPAAIKHEIGTPGPRVLLQAFGLREIGAGLAILFSRRPVTMVWGRVAGDLLDVGAVVPAAMRHDPRRNAARGALAFVLMATALDVYVAMQGDRR